MTVIITAHPTKARCNSLYVYPLLLIFSVLAPEMVLFGLEVEILISVN